MFHWIFAVFSGLLFFLSISLIVRRTTLNFKFLGIHLLLVAIILISIFYNASGLTFEYPHLFRLSSPLAYLLAPTHYFFIMATVRRDFTIKKLDLLHFLPFLLHIVELFPFYIQSSEEKQAVYAVFSALPPSELLTSEWGYFSYREHIIFKYLSGIVYAFVCLKFLWPTIKKKKSVEVTVAGKVLMWIKIDVFLKLFTFSLVFVIFLFFNRFPESLLHLHRYTFHLSSLFSALILLLFPELSLFGYVSFFNKEKPRAEGVVLATEANVSAGSANFSGPVAEEDGFALRLKQVLEENFHDEGLDVQTLARLMHLSERTLYRKTKEGTGKTPAQFLMDFRMEKAYGIIQGDPEKTIAAVATEVGLVSNGYFASAFSDRFGILPRDFQKLCKSQGESLS